MPVEEDFEEYRPGQDCIETDNSNNRNNNTNSTAGAFEYRVLTPMDWRPEPSTFPITQPSANWNLNPLGNNDSPSLVPSVIVSPLPPPLTDETSREWSLPDFARSYSFSSSSTTTTTTTQVNMGPFWSPSGNFVSETALVLRQLQQQQTSSRSSQEASSFPSSRSELTDLMLTII